MHILIIKGSILKVINSWTIMMTKYFLISVPMIRISCDRNLALNLNQGLSEKSFNLFLFSSSLFFFSSSLSLSDFPPSFIKQRLANSKAHTSRFISANLPCNKFKNRLVNIMPFESTRVCLQPIRGVEGSDYINASCIDGYRSAKAFIFF